MQKLDPGLKAAPGFKMSNLIERNLPFNLNPVFLSLHPVHLGVDGSHQGKRGEGGYNIYI